ncbi:hypothetical protein Sste5346_009089 [Sporothrix stenoceras]|uniref:BZIP domain-containing protein n=1 Tax=Sporothrix stenoceras TaxID=5173 RepID=A0ABR3YLH0_9PEZI
MPYMDSDLDILNAVQYDIGIPLPAMTRATRGAKRKLLSMSTEPEERRDYTESGSSNTTRPRMTTTKSTSTGAHESADTDLLSSVDIAPLSLAQALRQQEDNDMEGPPAPAPAKGGRKATAKRARGKAAVAAQAADNGDSEEDDEDGEEGEAETKRARGRPRIDVKDVTAADRRRTQIRLAQRAYRSRKEKAIVSLEKRVNSLKEANEAMSNAFMNLHDFAVGRGLLDQHPDLAQQLRQTTEVFLEMARQSSADEEMEDHEDDEANRSQGNNSNSNDANATNPHADEAERAFEKKQQAITDAVKTFGYQTQQDIANNNSINDPSTSRVPDVLSQQLMMPPQAAPIRQSNPLQNHLYGGIVMHQPLNLDGSNNAGPFDQQAANLFDSSLGMAMNIVNSVTNSPAGAAPIGSFYTGTASGNGASGTGTGTDSNGMSSSNSVLSVSPASGRNVDFGLGNQFSFDGPSFSLFPDYPSPTTGQAAVPTSTSDLAPHLADTDAFIASAAIGSPYAGLEPPTNYPPDISFGLRLRRYAIQSAYRLINSSDPPADAFARAFGFCIMFEPVDQIRQRLQRGLETPFTPSKFTRWELPFVNQNPDAADPPPPTVGDATAAPSIASHSSSRSTVLSHGSSKSQNSSASSRGSNRIPNNSNSDHRGTSVRPVTPRIHVTLPGFEGAFYDCEETEMYLQQRGVHIPPNSDSVIVEVDDADFALDDATTVVSSGTMNSSASSNTFNTANTANTSRSNSEGSKAGMGMFDYLSPDLITAKTALNGDSMDWAGSGLGGGAGGVAGTIAAAAAANASRGNDGNGAMNKDSSYMSSFMDNPMFGFPSPPQPNAAFPQRRLLSLDVDKFLKELVRRGTCLGQTPGFRASDVNEAFWSATRNASSM